MGVNFLITPFGTHWVWELSIGIHRRHYHKSYLQETCYTVASWILYAIGRLDCFSEANQPNYTRDTTIISIFVHYSVQWFAKTWWRMALHHDICLRDILFLLKMSINVRYRPKCCDPTSEIIQWRCQYVCTAQLLEIYWFFMARYINP